MASRQGGAKAVEETSVPRPARRCRGLGVPVGVPAAQTERRHSPKGAADTPGPRAPPWCRGLCPPVLVKAGGSALDSSPTRIPQAGTEGLGASPQEQEVPKWKEPEQAPPRALSVEVSSVVQEALETRVDE